MAHPTLLPNAIIPLIVILGPTAVGKTEISIQLAEKLNGEIVSADSRLFYRGMNIGTAKPTTDEMARVPHHLIDCSDPIDTWNLPRFLESANAAIADIHARGRLPFLVGGSGQYIHAILHGWNPPAVEPNESVRLELEALAKEHGYLWLHETLAKLDPVSALNIDPKNVRRTIRALEVIKATGTKFSAQRATSPCPYNLTQIGLFRPRPELYARIDARIEAMFAHGLLEEVEILLQQGCSASTSALSSIGYRECIQVLDGNITIDDAKRLMKKGTRSFVRRQANWFKMTDPAIHWFNAGESPFTKILGLIRPIPDLSPQG